MATKTKLIFFYSPENEKLFAGEDRREEIIEKTSCNFRILGRKSHSNEESRFRMKNQIPKITAINREKTFAPFPRPASLTLPELKKEEGEREEGGVR